MTSEFIEGLSPHAQKRTKQRKIPLDLANYALINGVVKKSHWGDSVTAYLSLREIPSRLIPTTVPLNAKGVFVVMQGKELKTCYWWTDESKKGLYQREAMEREYLERCHSKYYSEMQFENW
jgi:hypothetical protein